MMYAYFRQLRGAGEAARVDADPVVPSGGWPSRLRCLACRAAVLPLFRLDRVLLALNHAASLNPANRIPSLSRIQGDQYGEASECQLFRGPLSRPRMLVQNTSSVA